MAEAGGLAVHVTGDGPAVLFLHAFPLDSTQWDHQVAALSGHHTCIRPDVWGCGSSPPPPAGAATLDDYAGSVLDHVTRLGISRFAVVGLSMGGYVALAMWRLAAEHVTGLALCNTRAGADTDAARADRLAMAERVLSEADTRSIVEPNVKRLLGERAQLEVHIADPVRGRILRCTPAGIAFAQRAMAARPDSTGLLNRITVPTLVISGDGDAVIPAADTDALAAGIPDAAHVNLDCGHLSNLELPHDFSRVLEEFLGRLPSS